MMARRRVRYRRQLPPPESPPPTIPRRGRDPRPVPPTAPPPVPVVRHQAITERERMLREPTRQPLISVSPQLVNISQRIADFFSRIPGPGASPGQVAGFFSGMRGPGYDYFGGTQEAPPTTQADLPQADLSQAGLPGIGGGRDARIARRGGPEQLGARRFFTIVSAITRGVRPPLITFEAQRYLGYSYEEMKNKLGYELTAGGWVRQPIGGTVVDTYLGGSSEDGEIDWTLPSLPTYGGGSTQRLSKSGLINWRI